MATENRMEEYKRRWLEFEKKCRECRACPLCQNARTKVIFRGARHAPLMIIGEAPGQVEDEKGLPFVGKSGQLLQNLLSVWGLTERDYHICNIVKCRPPENRRPETAEIAACKKLLATQFRLVEPKVILLCGSVAYEAFYGTKPVMRDVRGIFEERFGYHIITTYHPAALLRDERKKIFMYEDLQKVRAKLTELGLKEEYRPVG